MSFTSPRLKVARLRNIHSLLVGRLSARSGVRGAASLAALSTFLSTSVQSQPVPSTAYEESSLATTDALEAGDFAGTLCDGIFTAGRVQQDVERDEVGFTEFPLPSNVADVRVHARDQYVTVRYAFNRLPRLAAFRQGYGCTILPVGSGADSFPLFRQNSVPLAPASRDLSWPAGDRVDRPERKDPRLERIVAGAIGSDYGYRSVTNGIVIVQHGKIVAEGYRPGFSLYTTTRTFSAAKTIASTVFGFANQIGLAGDVSSRADIATWATAGDPRRAITYDQLLHMSSGLQTVNAENGAQTALAYTGGIDVCKDATAQQLANKPGTKWHYSNYDVLLVMCGLRERIHNDDVYSRLPIDMFRTLGMNSTSANTDPYGNFILSSMVQTTPRDLARLGMLYLADGLWNGKRILPKWWVSYAIKPTKLTVKDEKGWSYGAFTWTDAGIGRETGAKGVFAALGNRRNLLMVVPEDELVIVRLGADPTNAFDKPRFLEDIVKVLHLK